MAAKFDNQEIFSNLSSIINQLHFGRTQDDRNILCKALDDLNALNYRYSIVTNQTKAVLLINQCCAFIPADDAILVQKFCQLLKNLITKQNVVLEGRTLTILVQWILQSLKIEDVLILVDVLLGLDAVLRCGSQKFDSNISIVRELCGLLEQKEQSGEVVFGCLQCLEASSLLEIADDGFVDLIAKQFIFYLSAVNPLFDPLTQSKILIVCLTGMQNLVLQNVSFLNRELGLILGVIKTFMLYEVKNIEFIQPQKLLPSTLSIPELATVIPREKKGGKITKQRKHRPAATTKKDLKTIINDDWLNDSKQTTGYTPATMHLDANTETASALNSSRLKTSDSDFSDGDSGKIAKLNSTNGRIRQTALNLFGNIVKLTEKSVMFSYWTSFVPEVAISNQHNLLTCILKDPSPRARMAALNVLLILLTSSKLYLSQAETSEKATAFTPFSVILGLMLKELHTGLSLALCEPSVPVLTQVLKCLAALVQATPYHRLSPGIITKIVRNVKGFIYHKDASVQVTALIVVGCVLASEPPSDETKQAMLKWQTEPLKPKQDTPNDNSLNATIDDIDFAEFSDEEEDPTANLELNANQGDEIPWLLKRCLDNLGAISNAETNPAAAPVKLESLQILSAMSRNYFDILMAPHLHLITKGLECALSDRYTDLRVHAGRAVDFIGQAINRLVSGDEKQIEHFNYFWQSLINNGALIALLQSEHYAVLRAVGCDCLGSIGSILFEQLPRDKQILCVTLLFSCTRDDENSVKGAAVRALAICVFYPSLREDPGFVVDTSEAIYRTLKDENLVVRVKSSWSLGNLSDALVLNSKANNLEDLPETLLLKLLKASIEGANDNDKIKMNAVRALGNLLQLLNADYIVQPDFKKSTEDALAILVKNSITGSNMKVRWNACYALGNAMKNSAIYLNDLNSIEKVFECLMELVVNFRNFKVRINAAVALTAPSTRQFYSNHYIPTWIALLKALENSQNMDDFSEYKHRDNLIEQICLGLGHLVTLLTKDDLLPLNDHLVKFADVFKIHMQKVLERLVPEKSEALLAASNTLAKFPSEILTYEQKEIITILVQIFHHI